jgi:SAM-dependent methyltransferase
VDRARIESEVRRLAPWYYRWDLEGVSTDLCPPCDHHGFRIARLPDAAANVLTGRTVLDVACNEGGYSFSALERGAAHVTGFDVRAINVEKARFVAEVRGIENARFQVASCDSWLERDPEPVDYVFLCGLLYHLVEPWRTIGEYCRLARRGVFVTCVLNGGADGYTPFPEEEGIAASEDPDELSQMPNTSRTIIAEFVRHGFLPVHVAEDRTPSDAGFWGGCGLLFRRCDGAEGEVSSGDDPLELQIVPRLSEDRPAGAGATVADILLYNWREEPLDVVGELVLTAPGGGDVGERARSAVTLPARVARTDGSSSESILLPVSLPPGTVRDGTVITATVREARSERILAERTLRLSGEDG